MYYEKTKKKRVIFLAVLLLSMIFYVGWVFYISEPTYIDDSMSYKTNADGDLIQKLEAFDFVTIPDNSSHEWTIFGNNVMTGMVLQADSRHALVKKFEGGYSWDQYVDLTIGKSHYRVIGSGTIYHKVNHYIGFNIMVITQVVISILLIVLMLTTYSTFFKILQDVGLM